MTVLRLDPVAGRAIDHALADLAAATLVRRPDGAFVEVTVAEVARLVRRLAFAGIAAAPCDADLGAPPGLMAAVGRDLAPLARGTAACDVVRVRSLTLGEATREILRRRFGGLVAADARARERARALLRGDDAVLAWSRRAWATRDGLRSRGARASLRPVVFDRAALADPALAGRTFASAGSLGTWLFS